MSQIDWSKAPEGATHFHPELEGKFSARWFMEVMGGWRVWHMGKWQDCIPSVSGISPDRFIEHPQAWAGEGLPPVGTVCELRHAPGGWGRATITHQGKGLTAWLWDHVNPDQVEYADCPDRLEFRTIRTKAQIAAEEREKAVSEMLAM